MLLEVFRQFSLGLELPPRDLPPIERVRAVVRQFAAALATPEWQRALPALLGAAWHQNDLAALHDRIDAHHAKVLSTVLRDAVAAGALPAETDIGEALLLLFGPLFMAALMRPEAVTEAFVDRLVDRLFAIAKSPSPIAMGEGLG